MQGTVCIAPVPTNQYPDTLQDAEAFRRVVRATFMSAAMRFRNFDGPIEKQDG